jgi:hypothetical protein
MKTKVLKVEISKNNIVLCLLRWNNKPISGDFSKVYVNYVYPYSQEKVDFDYLSTFEKQLITNKIIDFCQNQNLILWSY